MFFCLSLAILESFASASVAGFATNGRITGSIKDARTGAGLRGANVVLEGTSLGAASDTSGAFAIEDVPPGEYPLSITFIGYRSYRKDIRISPGEAIHIEVSLEPVILEAEGLVVTARLDAARAVVGETPAAFTTVSQTELKGRYTTGDLPELVTNVPGVWVSTAGLGEAEMWIRGFGGDDIQFVVNGVPMNALDDRSVSWSDWAALAGTVYSLQVQRGPGFALYGAAGFGGSVQMEAMGVGYEKSTSARLSIGFLNTSGATSGPRPGEVAVGDGSFAPAALPVNYVYSFRHDSGPLHAGKLFISIMGERKTGDSYLQGTGYDGYGFGLETLAILGSHRLRLSFLGAPQRHNRAFALQDTELLNTLGREYNRKSHPWEENSYFKPLWTVRHEWNLSHERTLVSTAYFSLGRGRDQSLANGVFNVETGAVDYQPLSKARDYVAFGRHAMYLESTFGIRLPGYLPSSGGDDPPTFLNYPIQGQPGNFYTNLHTHSWQTRVRRDQSEFGLITYLQQRIGGKLGVIAGGETTSWRGHHSSEAWKLRVSDSSSDGQPSWREQAQHLYDFDTWVWRSSGFGRLTFTPLDPIVLQAGAQASYTSMRVRENPIFFYDFANGGFLNISYRTTADQLDENGQLKFSEDDYRRTHALLTPWGGCNINLGGNSVFVKYVLAYKEPTIEDWYDFAEGPGVHQGEHGRLRPEKADGFELGLVHHTASIEVSASYYRTWYADKIESVLDIENRRRTINAGRALFEGVEVALGGELGRLEFSTSATLTRNRWREMNVSEVFGAAAADVVGKTVPFAPQRIVYSSLGYKERDYSFRLHLYWWDRYYATFTNRYTRADGSVVEAVLPSFFDLGAQFAYSTRVQKVGVTFRLDLNNITNRADNFMKAQYSIDYTRNDSLAGTYHWYVLQAPLFNAFLTMEVNFY